MESRTLRVRVARHLGYIMLAAVSCRDSVGPDARSTRLFTGFANAAHRDGGDFGG